MKNLILVIAIFGSASCFSQDYNNAHKNYIEVGYTGGTYSNTGANIGVFGAVGQDHETLAISLDRER